MVIIGSDHGGYELKEQLLQFLSEVDKVEDIGCYSPDAVDFSDIAELIAVKVLESQGARGIAICGSGIGISIAVNRFPGIYAALVHSGEQSKEITRLSRQHNNANVLCLGGRFMDLEEAKVVIQTFLQTEHLKEEPKYARRMTKTDALKIKEGR